MRHLLIRNGLLIDTDPIRVLAGHDLLVTDGRIAAVGPGLTAEGAEVLDATDRIVLPGFVDAHRHTWQTALRGVATDLDLGGYLDLVAKRFAPHHRPAEVHTSTLAGALEALASGITTLQDFAHIQFSPEHADAAVSALRASGIRAVFAHGKPVFGPDLGAEEVRRVHREHFASGEDLVTMALAPTGPSYAPMDLARRDWQLARELGLRMFVHTGSGPVAERPVHALRDAGLLGADITFVHANSLPDEELDLIARAGAAVAITPAVEARMGHGAPMIGRLLRHGISTGLGVDVVTSVAGDMFSLMRAALLTGQFGAGVRPTPADVLRLATVDGAAAVGLADRVGSLALGKQADLVLLRANDVNLLGGLHDPVGTVVTAAHPGNIDTVLVGGRPVRTSVPDELVLAVRESAARLAAV
ncbi:amidohydrolase family protein [Kutzneria viridogrisea]|uniref:Cytosine/adenosine deaminase-related metal-dependent hydrolase n=1 Tax=Kutzneria viridogrisea TaxID=47990 RepID=A0ABR6BD09_9PSEU|nr:cytosine/adenosine deaminase-related metal-dependent hydrolase [Kutzneria viridogrisea]